MKVSAVVRSVLSALLFCLLLCRTGMAQYDPRPFFDANFDTDAVGTSPVGWVRTLQGSTGSSVAVTNAQATTATQGMELKSTGLYTSGISGLRRTDLAAKMPVSDNIMLSFNIRFSTITDQQFRYLFINSSVGKIGNMQILFRNGSVIAQYGLSTLQSQVVGSYAANTWYEVLIHVNPAASSYSVTFLSSSGSILGQKTNLPNSFTTQPAGLCFCNDGALVTPGAKSVFLDSVALVSVFDANLGFESDMAGDSPLNWETATQSSTGSSVKVTSSVATEGFNSLELRTQGSYYGGGTPSSSATSSGKTAFLPPSANDMVSFSVQLSHTDQQLRFFLLDRVHGLVGYGGVTFNAQGQVRALHQLANLTSATSTFLCNYSANTWYDVEITHTPGTDAFDIVVKNGATVVGSATNLANKFLYPPESVRFLNDGLMTSGSTGQRSVFVDNIKLSGPRYAGKNIYVATTGSDSNPGTQALPYLTIYHAVSRARPGDTILVANGTYNETKNVTFIQYYGVATAMTPIVMKPEVAGTQPKISFTHVPPTPIASQKLVMKQNYVTIQGFEITEDTIETNNTSDILVYFDNGTYGGTALGNTIHNAYEECLKGANASNLTFKDNILYDTEHEGIDVVNGENIVFSGNTVYRVKRCGILAKGGARNVRIFDNHVYTDTATMSGGIYLGGQSAVNAVYDPSGYEIYNSVAYNNAVISTTPGQMTYGIVIMGGKEAAVLHNVVVGAKSGLYITKTTGDAALGWTWDPQVMNARIQNNIFQDCTVQAVNLVAGSLQGSYTNSYNFYYNCTNNTNVPATNNNTTQDPSMVNKYSDWHYPTSSPARNAGTPVTSITGFNGETFDVSQDRAGTSWLNPPDIGVYEQ